MIKNVYENKIKNKLLKNEGEMKKETEE